MRIASVGNRWGVFVPGVLLAALVLASACAPRKTAKRSGTLEDPSMADSSMDSGMAPNVDVEEARLRGKEFMQTADLKTITFDYDMYSLSADARAVLGENATYLKSHPDLEVLVEGHCDERGTVEYNLALGQRRAKEVRDYYMRLGVPGKSVGTISFGEERPACADSNEDCWSRNRRAETKIRSRTASNGFHKTLTP